MCSRTDCARKLGDRCSHTGARRRCAVLTALARRALVGPGLTLEELPLKNESILTRRLSFHPCGRSFESRREAIWDVD